MRDFLRQIIGLSLIRLLLDMLLPDSDQARFALLGVELCAVLCMLRGLMTLLKGWML